MFSWYKTFYNNRPPPPHWNFLCSDRSKFNMMRWWILVIVTFLCIDSDKITKSKGLSIKVIWEIILMEMKKSARRRHCSKIIKTNLKTHISPLLNHPQGCLGYKKNWKDLRITTMIRFVVNIKPKLKKKTQNITKKTGIFQRFLLILKVFMQFIQFWLKISSKTDHGCDS